MVFDGTITLGTIISTMILLGGFVAFVLRFSKANVLSEYRLAEIEKTSKALQENISSIAKTLASMSDQERRLEFLEKIVDDLRRGEGMILPLRPAKKDYPNG